MGSSKIIIEVKPIPKRFIRALNLLGDSLVATTFIGLSNLVIGLFCKNQLFAIVGK